MKKAMICLLSLTIFLVGCSLSDFKENDTTVDSDSSKAVTQTQDDSYKEKDTTENTKNSVASNNNIQNSDENSDTANISLDKNISEKVKGYIINGQENKSSAEKLNWSKNFLEQVDIENLYQQYIIAGGDASDIEKIAQYITGNAPINSNWQELFEQDLYDTYREKVSKIEKLDGDIYQVYVNKENLDVPFVVVSSRTGYFHG